MRLLGTAELNWRDLKVIIQHLPHESAVAIAVTGEKASYADYMLTTIANASRSMLWAFGQANGARKTPPPEPIYPPGVAKPAPKWGGEGVPLDEMRERLGWST